MWMLQQCISKLVAQLCFEFGSDPLTDTMCSCCDLAPIPPPVEYLKANQYVLPDVIIRDLLQQFPKEFGQELKMIVTNL